MKNQLLLITAVILLFFKSTSFGQEPNLRTAGNFTLFTTTGAVGSTGISRVIGRIGANTGDITGFDIAYNEIYNDDPVTLQCSDDLLIAYEQLDLTSPTFFPAPLLGNGQVLYPGVYSIPQAATLSLDLSFDAQGDPNALFIIKITGAFSTTASAKVHLINGALAKNVFWNVEGAIAMATGTYMRGNLIANNGAISMGAGDTLEGRALSTTGAISIYGSVVYAPGLVLPVKLISFKATKANDVIDLLWTSSNEVSFGSYELQRSIDGHNFYKLAAVPATNTPFVRNYNWRDNTPIATLNFYRLKMIDIDQVYKYSCILKIDMLAKKSVSLYPNPIVGNTIQLQMNGQPKGEHTINLYNTQGEKMMSTKISHSGNDAIRSIELNKNLPDAVYYLEISDPGKNRQTLKILIQ